MGYDPLILHRVRSLAGQKEAELKEADLYQSRQMKDYLENLSATFLQKEKLNVNVVMDGRDGIVACTNGDSIFINCESCISSRYETPEDRWVAFMGIFSHEIAHCLYLDFETSRMAGEAIEAGELYGKRPDGRSDEEKRAVKEICAALKSPEFRPVFLEICHTLDNTFSDRHDEDCMIRDYGGLCEAGIRKARESLFSFSALFDETEEMVENGVISRLGAFYNTLLVYSRFGTIPLSDEDLWRSSDLLRKILSVRGEIDTAGTTHDSEERWACINRILLAVWPYIREELHLSEERSAAGQGVPEKSGNGPSGSGGSSCPDPKDSVSGSPGADAGGKKESSGSVPRREGSAEKESSADGSAGSRAENRERSASAAESDQVKTEFTAGEAEAILVRLQEGANRGRQAQAPVKRRSSVRPAVKAEGKGDPLDPSVRKKSREALEEAVRNIRRGIAETRARDELEAKMASDLIRKQSAVGQNPGHRGIAVRFLRDLEYRDRREYESIMEEVRPYSRRLQRSVTEALKERREMCLAKHQPYGRILVVPDTYRPDGLYYARKKLPPERPDMAVSLLVDCSGSMDGERIEAAKKAAVMLYDFASELGIPVYVAGHCARSAGVFYQTYADFERVTKNDCFRICGMKASGCNRDGCAIEISANLLAARPEEIRLLLVISDGQPNHNGYCGSAAASDIQSIIRKYRKSNVEILAAGIGSDRESVSSIYGSDYLDISDLQELPRQMTNLVRKRILQDL